MDWMRMLAYITGTVDQPFKGAKSEVIVVP